MITVRSDDLTENQLAQIALSIQNRWQVATFVKMHEIVVLDDEDYSEASSQIILQDFERGFRAIMEFLEIGSAFDLVREGKTKYKMSRVPNARLPNWITDTQAPSRAPQGIYECPHCVSPDTLILGDNKPISDYYAGDTAVGETGPNEVIQKFVRRYVGVMTTIRANGLLPIVTTPEHPILVITGHSFQRRHGHRSRCEIQFSEERWVAAKDIVTKTTNKDGNYVILPIIKGNFERYEVELMPFIKKLRPNHRGYREYFPLNEDTAWLLGLYTAEGSVTEEVRFSLNRNETEIEAKVAKIARELGYSSYTKYLENENSMLVSIPSRVLARAFDEWCGHKASNKMIPDFVLYHQDEKIIKAFLQGYETGDGYVATNKWRGNKTYRVDSTTSRILAQQLQLAFVRLRKWASICIKTKKTVGSIMGRKCSLHVQYIVSYPLEPNDKRQKVRFLEDKVVCPIRNIKKERYVGDVYNIETSDNTYLVSNAVVHNCGKWFNNDVEYSAHTRLHYII